jgi:hypothetical protein
VAGIHALAGNRPRAVLLVLGYSPKDVSRYDAGAVSRYLESVQVPLAVWSVGDSKLLAGWTGAEEVSTVTKLEAAFTRLRDNLATQHIVWIEGRHLPGAVTLSPAAAEVVELVR